MSLHRHDHQLRRVLRPLEWLPAQELGLGFDDWDFEYYTNMFRNDVKR